MESLKTNKTIYRIVLLIIALLMIVMSFNHGITGDEDDASAYGKAILSYMATGGDDTTALHMPEALDRDHILHLYGGAFDMSAALIHKVIPINEFTLRHILNALAGFLAIFFASRIVLLFSNHRAAILVCLLMFFFPFFLGHSMNNPKDVPFAAAYIASIYYIIRFWKTYPKVDWKNYLPIILSVAIALNIRIAALLLIAYSGLWLGLLYWTGDKVRKSQLLNLKTIGIFIGINVGAYLLAVLFWPYALQAPFSNPFIALETFSNLQISLAQIWEGQKVLSADLPWYYIPKSILITSPFVFISGLMIMILFIPKWLKGEYKTYILFIGFIAVFPVFYIIYKHSNVFHLWRHVLFVFPGLAILSALGWETLIDFFTAKGKKMVSYVPYALFVLMLLEPIVFIARSQPNEVTYFNPVVGGPKEAYTNYEFDYYYNGLKPSVDYLIKNVIEKTPKKDSIIITSNAVHLLACYLVDYPWVKLQYNRYYELNEATWDYAVLHKALIPPSKLASGSWLPEKYTLFENKVFELPLSAVIKRPGNENRDGMAALKAGDLTTAKMDFIVYLQKDPKNIDILTQLADLFSQQGKMDSASFYIQQALSIEPDDMQALMTGANIQANNGQVQEAINIYTRLINENPQMLQLHYYLGLAYMRQGNAQAALQSLNTASQMPQLASPCYKAMGDIYMQLGQTEQANKLYGLIQQ